MKRQIVKNIIAIALGATVGTSLRYYLNLYTLAIGYPIGTVLENLIGSGLLGFLTGWFVYRHPREWIKVGLGVGLCGGFTTMSTMASDSVFLLLERTLWMSSLYLVVSIFGGIILAFLGYMLGQKLGYKQTEREGSKV
ncbi:fluoride efflux transporter FluC [Alkalihalobacillus deserti]|uniref:fluoride efflux transporter FluC n=1 Tax=Alkalihalobacillus deserti TaxID=2879466 RepID=UPI001D14DFB1|nr:CrcB family protein [Alkalihalobacillus deserti]